MTKVEVYLTKRGPQLRVSISEGNKKMGYIPSISLPPIASFFTKERICVKCDCNKKCYARCHVYCINKQPAACYEDNYYTLKNEPDMYWKAVEATCMMNRVFRYHVSGDIIDLDYFEHMVDIAKRNPHCETLCFTKKYGIVNAWIKKNGELPPNLHMIFSAWKGLPMSNPFFMPECHLIYKDGSTTASDEKTSFLCSGNCSECYCQRKNCFELKKNEQILIKEH